MLLTRSIPDPVRLTVERGPDVIDASVEPVDVCDFRAVVIVEGDINAFADGNRVIFPWAMMRFADDEELIGVLGHEIAHNAMGHIEARKTNALWGGILGAVFDVALATQGVSTYGENTANFMNAAARAVSQDFEREADYVGMYLLARAGLPLEMVPGFWRQFAQRAVREASADDRGDRAKAGCG
jgi:predicted Zn-dependent protease